MTNPLRQTFDEADRVYPPKGKSPEDVAARQRFWIEHGNLELAKAGMSHLHWVCRNDHYSLEPRGG